MTRIYRTPFADEGDREATASTAQVDGKMSMPLGWTTDYELSSSSPDYRPVGRKEMNGVLYEVTKALGEIQQYGYAIWQAGTWPKGSITVHNGVSYRARRATSGVPSVSGDWRQTSPVCTFESLNPEAPIDIIDQYQFIEFIDDSDMVRIFGSARVEFETGQEVASIPVNDGLGGLIGLSIQRYTSGQVSDAGLGVIYRLILDDTGLVPPDTVNNGLLALRASETGFSLSVSYQIIAELGDPAQIIQDVR